MGGNIYILSRVLIHYGSGIMVKQNISFHMEQETHTDTDTHVHAHTQSMNMPTLVDFLISLPFQKYLFLYFLVVCRCMFVSRFLHSCTCAHRGWKEGIKSFWSWISCELPEVGTENRNQVLCKNNMCS